MRLELPGRWDASRQLHPDLRGVRRLEVDLSQTTSLDAAAFADLVRIIRQVWSHGGEVRLLGPQGPVLEMIRESMLDRAVTVV